MYFMENSNIKGKLSELEILTYITRLGYSVSIPFGDKDKYDQIWDIHGKLYKVQIKTSRWKDDRQLGIIFNRYSISNGKRHVYSKEDIDFFATYWNNKCYLIPIEECSQEKTLWFQLAPRASGNCCMAADYEVEKMIEKI